MSSSVPWSRARENYVEAILDFAVCGIITLSGTQAYLNDEQANQSGVERHQEAQSARRTLNMLLAARAIDNFNAYLTDLLIEILTKDPRPIFGRNVSAKLLFESPDLASAKKLAIKRFISELGYQAIDEQAQSLQKMFGLESLSHWLTKRRVYRLTQMRNIITHNRGIVNSIFLLRSGSKIDTLGEHVAVPNALLVAKYLDGVVRRLDNEAVAKFKLRGSVNA